MKKRAKIFIIILIILGVLYSLLEYTSRGRIVGLYLFSSFKTPLSIKIDCINSTNKKVAEKFELPLNFDQSSKNALREFWHFSYYRSCILENGYDFYGNTVNESEIYEKGGVNYYTNYFGKISFIIPKDSLILKDNLTDPDVEDRRISSLVEFDNVDLNILVYRTFDEIDTFQKLETGFTNFSTSTGKIISKETMVNENLAELIEVEQDDGFSGVVTITNKGYVIQIFGKKLPSNILKTIESSIEFLK